LCRLLARRTQSVYTVGEAPIAEMVLLLSFSLTVRIRWPKAPKRSQPVALNPRRRPARQRRQNPISRVMPWIGLFERLPPASQPQSHALEDFSVRWSGGLPPQVGRPIVPASRSAIPR